MSHPAAAFEIEYPEHLPVSAARDEIAAALAGHQVIIVCGDTGSGKTTQLPKICLDNGRGRSGMIGHTQPRRLAARAVAARIAEELGSELGDFVGYQVRFNDRTAPGTRIKLMTDGILLNEIRSDRKLSAYDTIIIDEAHERTLNVDFLLGYLKLALRRRKDLRVIVTSATVDADAFSAYFDGAPVITVGGRQFPVSIEYRPVDEDEGLIDAVVDACGNLARDGTAEPDGSTHDDTSEPRPATNEVRDILVFLPGERWIREAERALGKSGPEGYEVLPLFARMSASQQERIFRPGPKPRIVLATNIAETSVTVPRIGFVVDSGLARVSRYSVRHRIQTLRVEPIARANAVQRAGRCGRLGPGACVRLYAEDDFESRPAYTDPEILRTNLAGILLRLRALGLGPIGSFPFIDPPPDKAVNDAERLLQVLNAVNETGRLTQDGRKMARLPLDPRLARLLVMGQRTRCLAEMLVIAAALSTADPRETPDGQSEQARERHAEFEDPRSDFATLLRLWEAYSRARRPGAKKLRAWCRLHFLSLRRMTEWDDVHGQLKSVVGQIGWRVTRAKADPATFHRAILAAFVDYIAEREDDGTYRGMHGVTAGIFPGSGVARKRPRWIVAAEHVATERNFLRVVAQINPRWVMQVAPHLVRREYSDPRWDPKLGFVAALETVTAFGLTLSRDRRVDYGRIDSDRARAIFLDDALAGDDLGAQAAFLDHNRAVRDQILEWEARIRSRDLYIGSRGLARFYAERLPARVRDRRSLLEWLNRQADARVLQIGFEDLMTRDVRPFIDEHYPTRLECAGQALTLRYRYDPGVERDGITLRLPHVLIDSVAPARLEWLVPGLLRDKVLAMLRTLRKELRRPLVPLPETVDALLPELERRYGTEPLAAAISAVAAERLGQSIPADAFRDERLDRHLLMRVELIDEQGVVLTQSRDFAALRREFGGTAAPGGETGGVSKGDRDGSRTRKGKTGADAPAPGRSRTMSHWDCGTLDDLVSVARYGMTLELYPALIDAGRAVELDLLPPGPAAVARHGAGVRRLLLLQVRQQSALLRDTIIGDRELLLGFHGIGSGDALVDDIVTAAADECFERMAEVRSREAFDACLAGGRARYVPSGEMLVDLVRSLLPDYRTLSAEIRTLASRDHPAAGDLASQLEGLVRPGFLTATPPEWRKHLPRYLKAMRERIDKLRHRSTRDGEYQSMIERAWARYAARVAELPPGWPVPDEIVRYRWLVEELRVSLFAQGLGTSAPVSARRLERCWQDLTTEVT